MDKKPLIETIFTRPTNGVIPTLLSFQNGNLSVSDKDKMQYSTLLNRETKSKEAFLAVDGQVYSGPINATESSKLTDNYICVRNKSTNKVRIFPIDEAIMKNHIYVELQRKQLEDAHININDKTAKNKLIKEFGGRRMANALDKDEKMQISMDIIKEDLDSTIRDTVVNENSVDEPKETPLEYICPKYNKDAKTLEEIYNINDLMPTSLLSRLEAEAKAVYAAEANTLPIKSQHLLSNLDQIKSSQIQQSERLLKTKILIFLDCLHNFLTSKQKAFFKMELSGITEKIETYLRTQFFEQPGRVKNSKYQDRALCYYIALCLILDNKHSLDLSALAKEIGKPKSSLLRNARLVNALPKSSGSDIVTLRLPSKVPALKSGRLRR